MINEKLKVNKNKDYVFYFSKKDKCLPSLNLRYKNYKTKLRLPEIDILESSYRTLGGYYSKKIIIHESINQCKTIEDITDYMNTYGFSSMKNYFYQEVLWNIEFDKSIPFAIYHKDMSLLFVSKDTYESMRVLRKYDKYKFHSKDREVYVLDVSKIRKSFAKMNDEFKKSCFHLKLAEISEGKINFNFGNIVLSDQAIENLENILLKNWQKIQKMLPEEIVIKDINGTFNDLFTYYPTDKEISVRISRNNKISNFLKYIYLHDIKKIYNKEIMNIIPLTYGYAHIKLFLEEFDNPLKIQMFKKLKIDSYFMKNNLKKLSKILDKFGGLYVKNPEDKLINSFISVNLTHCDNEFDPIKILEKYSMTSLIRIYEHLDESSAFRSGELYSKIIKIALNNNLKIEEFGEYIATFEIRQGVIFDRVMITTYEDYLNMRKMVLNEKVNSREYRLYPSSLKLNHDLVAKDYSLIKEKIDKEKESKILNSEDYLKNEFFGDDIVMIAPKELRELAREGRELSHCVGSYGRYILDGVSKVYFIRKKDKTDSPYITLEIRNDKLSQIQGKSTNVSQLINRHKSSFKKLFSHLKNNNVSVSDYYFKIIEEK